MRHGDASNAYNVLNGTRLGETKIKITLASKAAYNHRVTLKTKKQFVSSSLVYKKNGVLVVYIPPASFPLFGVDQACFADRRTNRRYFASHDEAKTYACLAFIFDNRDYFSHFPAVAALWDLPPLLDRDSDGITVHTTNDEFPPAMHMIASYKTFVVPSHTVATNSIIPNLVAVRLKKGGIVHYCVNPCNNLQRSSLFNLTRPYPSFVDENKKRLQFTHIIKHSNNTRPLVLHISVLSPHGPVTVKVKMHELAAQCPRICFDYAMRNQLFQVDGFFALSKRKVESQEGQNEAPCSEDKNARYMHSTGLCSPNLTWKGYGAPGCSKCRDAGCRTCFEMQFGPIDDLSVAEVVFFGLKPAKTIDELKKSGMVDKDNEGLQQAPLLKPNHRKRSETVQFKTRLELPAELTVQECNKDSGDFVPSHKPPRIPTTKQSKQRRRRQKSKEVSQHPSQSMLENPNIDPMDTSPPSHQPTTSVQMLVREAEPQKTPQPLVPTFQFEEGSTTTSIARSIQPTFNSPMKTTWSKNQKKHYRISLKKKQKIQLLQVKPATTSTQPPSPTL